MLFHSCSKEQISIPEEVSSDVTSHSLIQSVHDDPLSCDCLLWVKSTHVNTSVQNDDWITQVLFDGPGNISILQIGGNLNIYDTPNKWASYPFSTNGIDQNVRLRALASASFGLSEFPWSLQTRVTCENASFTGDLTLELDCLVIGPNGCSQIDPNGGPAYYEVLGHIQNCSAQPHTDF